MHKTIGKTLRVDARIRSGLTVKASNFLVFCHLGLLVVNGDIEDSTATNWSDDK